MEKADSVNIAAWHMSSERALRPTRFRTACLNASQLHYIRKQSGQ